MISLLFILTINCLAHSLDNNQKDLLSLIQGLAHENCPLNNLKGKCHICEFVKNKINSIPTKIGSGWDPITAEIKLPIFKYTYSKNTTYITKSGKLFHVPDQFSINHHELRKETNTKIYSNIDEYLNAKQNQKTIASSIMSIPVEMIRDIFHFFGFGSNQIVSVSEYATIMKLSFDHLNLTISDYVNKIIQKLPIEYNEDLYMLFIKYFGTQVIIDGSIGAVGMQTVMIKKCFGNIALNNEAAYYLLKTFYPMQYSHITMNSSFMQYSKVSVIDIYGGNPTIVDPSKWQDRLNTVDDYPVFTHINVVPITNFIHNTTIKNNLEKAIEKYLSTSKNKIDAYQKEYLDSTNTAKYVEFIPTTKSGDIIVDDRQTSILNPNRIIYYKKPGAFGYSLFSMFGCYRLNVSHIQSVVDPLLIQGNDPQIKGWDIRVDIPMSEAVANGGCAVSQYTFTRADSGFGVVLGYCCIDCIPDIICNDQSCYFKNCKCPTF